MKVFVYKHAVCMCVQCICVHLCACIFNICLCSLCTWFVSESGSRGNVRAHTKCLCLCLYLCVCVYHMFNLCLYSLCNVCTKFVAQSGARGSIQWKGWWALQSHSCNSLMPNPQCPVSTRGSTLDMADWSSIVGWTLESG